MQEIGNRPKNTDISLYIHIPFCAKKCPYCHFYVVKTKEELIANYLEALFSEWELVKPLLQNKSLKSLYLGGGTPSQLSLSDLEKILGMVFSFFTLSSDIEITIEINPDDSSDALMQGLKNLGINRVSLGVQSLDSESLIILGREHSSSKAVQAITQAYNAGIHNISIDLMYDLPSQTLASWNATLKQLESLPITHLSLYNLTIEPHTSFYKRKKELSSTLPSDEQSLAMLQLGVEAFEKMGLKRYEISAFAKEGLFSYHNTGYWMGREFLGLGPSAFSFFGGERFQNVCSLPAYIAALKDHKSPVDFKEKLVFPDSLHEHLAIELRLMNGINIPSFEEAWGQIPSETRKILQDLASRDFLSIDQDHIRLLDKGYLFYDTVAAELV